ncbi:MAG: Uncharacterised protein [Cellulomonadaceae bacterium TMED98]|nr:MAG: Uncharacterised protein [Cellulomonadaceae bacterium TMED98]
MNQIDNQLQLVEDLEIGDFWLVTSFCQHFEAVLNELRGPPTEHGLLTKQIGFRLFGERRGDAASAETTESFGVRPGEVPRAAGRIVFHRDNNRHAATRHVFPAHGVTGALRGHQQHVHACRGLDVAKANVESVAKDQSFAVGQVRGDVLAVEVALVLVGSEHHDHVGPGGRLRSGHHLKARLFGFRRRLRAFLQGHDDLHTRVTEVLGVGVTLRAIAHNGHLLAGDDA